MKASAIKTGFHRIGVMLAAIAYGFAWALGWVFSGFSGDETSAAPHLQNKCGR